MNVFVYLADDAVGSFNIDIRAQYTNSNGSVLESGAKGLNKLTDAEGKTIYSVNGLTATGMSSLNKLYTAVVYYIGSNQSLYWGNLLFMRRRGKKQPLFCT